MDIYNGVDIKLSLVYMSPTAFSIVLWYSMLCQKNNVRNLISSLKSHPATVPFKKLLSYFVSMILLVFLIMPFCLASVATYTANEAKCLSNFWTFGITLENQIYKMGAHFVGEYMYYSVYFEFPCVAVLSVYLMIHYCGNNLLQCNYNAKNMDYLELTVKGIDVQEDYRIIEENIRLLKKILSLPLFVILLNSLFNLYVVLTYCLKDKIPPCMMVELTVSALTGVIIISSLIIHSAKISENMLKMKETINFLIEKHQLHIQDKGREMSILKRIEKKDIIYLSACGMIDFKRNLLLTAFGSLFTYGLIIFKLG
ncbi:hypothetical protein HNY73_019560 [Argiope bruennichi]|uniref:Uncharacterized protein n=1 Tax=Argiope bruennichi TaxID=94029 RepID=A0A8T0E5G6_ARGBR|nr:hypothetical protein HNY73_019560 [Argiope bruennichi]